jgi:hypothetical protein
VSGLDGRAAERDREVRLADAGRSEHQHVFGAGDEATGRELAHELVIDRWLELEIELVERLHRREVRDLNAHGDAFLLFGVSLLGENLVEKVEIGRLAARRLRQDPVEPLGDGTKPKLEQALFDPRSHQFGAHAAPPTQSA